MAIFMYILGTSLLITGALFGLGTISGIYILFTSANSHNDLPSTLFAAFFCLATCVYALFAGSVVIHQRHSSKSIRRVMWKRAAGWFCIYLGTIIFLLMLACLPWADSTAFLREKASDLYIMITTLLFCTLLSILAGLYQLKENQHSSIDALAIPTSSPPFEANSQHATQYENINQYIEYLELQLQESSSEIDNLKQEARIANHSLHEIEKQHLREQAMSKNHIAQLELQLQEAQQFLHNPQQRQVTSEAQSNYYADVSSVDHMEGHQFEQYCANLLQKVGYTHVRITQGSGDQGVDILAEKDGIRYAIQCKNYSSKLGNTPVQEVNSGKLFYNCHVAVVITNSTFTQGAIDLAKATNVLLWDRSKLKTLMENIPQ